MAMIKWNKGEAGAPRDRRLLLIGTPLGMPVADQEPDLVIGHWHEGNWGYVAVRPPYDENALPRPSLKILWWAEIPDLPDQVELRALVDRDMKG
jgi:hypothetical protein